MKEETVTSFTEKEEEFANLLIKIGIRKSSARILVFLAKTPEATSQEIERGTDLRQPEVSVTVHYLMDRGWIRSCGSTGENKGRPIKIYKLAKPFNEIMDCIGKDKVTEVNNTLALVQKVREHLC